MAEFKHLCMAKFKEGVVVDDIIQELTKLAAELDTVKFFGWYACICISFVLFRKRDSNFTAQHTSNCPPHLFFQEP